MPSHTANDEIVIVADSLSFVVYGHRDYELAVIGAMRNAIDFQRDDGSHFAKRIFKDCNMAYRYLRQFRNFSIGRDEFFRSWGC
jgi:hypothetical protein